MPPTCRERNGIDHALDVTSEDSWRAVIGEVERENGRLDGLVNAAGIALLGTVEETDFASRRRVLAVNLDGTFLGCKHALPLLKRGGGSIVNLSSISGIVGGPNLAAYDASKGVVRLLEQVGGAPRRAACVRRCGAIPCIRHFWKGRWSTTSWRRPEAADRARTV